MPCPARACMTEQKNTDGLRSTKRVRIHSGMSGVLQRGRRVYKEGRGNARKRCRLTGEAADCQEWLQTARRGWRLSGMGADCQERLETVRSGWRLSG
jgi:hypothetical protein